MACVGDTVNLSTLHSFLQRNSSPTSSGSHVVSYTHDLGQGPVLWLVHGWPQSSYIFRHIVPTLKDKVSLFIPELPGYGVSTPASSTTRHVIGSALLEASHAIFPNRPIILGGHDRGARILHRLTVSHAHPSTSPTPELFSFDLLGVVLLDIAPTLVQWQVFSKPQALSAYYHWAFLAASDISADMIEAFGGDKYCTFTLERTAGSNAKAAELIKSDRAYEVYSSLFAKRETIEGACADYKAAVAPEPQEQEDDQKQGRKIEVPTLVMWSEGSLGKMHGNVEEIWRQWVKEGVELRAVGCGDGVGHYLPEEAKDKVGEAISDFVDAVGKGK